MRGCKSMSNSLKTFLNLFDSEIQINDNNSIRPKKIVIPIIQRDYAQGRNTPIINRVRKNFLDAIYDAVTKKPMTMDFIYGDIDPEGTLIPLDGQQRLTTLFLIHWYAAKKEKISSEETKVLKNFFYEIRPDTHEFCQKLIDYKPTFKGKSLAAEIENQSWFPLNWKKDPTVSAMLNMLYDIDKKFCKVRNLWKKLKDGAISFYFLPIKNLGLTDEIYITMNSRGKILTEFEHFKAVFKSHLDLIDVQLSNEFLRKIDIDWTNLLWTYRDSKNLIDTAFLNYFNFLYDVIFLRRYNIVPNKNKDILARLDDFFSFDTIEVLENLQYIADGFDCWLNMDSIEKFFNDRVSRGSRNHVLVNSHEEGKFISYFDTCNFFSDCLLIYNKGYTNGRMLVLYAFVTYLLNQDKVSDKDFRRRIRIVTNLVYNSEEEIDKNENTNKNSERILNAFKIVNQIILEGVVDNKISPGFNQYQIDEEKEKLEWTQKNPDKEDGLFELEDNYRLYGQIGIVGLENYHHFKKFIDLFYCYYVHVDCALLTKGNYFQIRNQLYQGGSLMFRSWQSLFHRDYHNEGFENTKKILNELLDEEEKFTVESLEKLADDYIAECKRENSLDWRYYYIKYPIFRPERYGRFYWEDIQNKPYKMLVCWAANYLSAKAYQPFLKAIVNEKIFELCYNKSLETPRLIFENHYVECVENGFSVVNLKTNKQDYAITVEQKDGLDCEDRIVKFQESKILEKLIGNQFLMTENLETVAQFQERGLRK